MIGYKTERLTYSSCQPLKWIEGLVAAVFIMSVIDGVLTLFWVLMDFAEEANPLMDYLLKLHPALFMTVKVTLVALGTALIWRHRFRPLAVAGVCICFLVYSAILATHLGAAGSCIHLLRSGMLSL